MKQNLIYLSIAFLASHNIYAGDYRAVIQKYDGENLKYTNEPDNNLIEEPEPTPSGQVVRSLKNIEAGQDHSIAINNSGNLIVVGYNSSNTLGLGHSNPVNDWTVVPNLNNIVDLGTYGYNSYALDSSGNVYSSTTNWSIVHNNIKEIAVGNDYILAVDNNGELWGFGDNGNGQFGDGTRNDKTSWTKINTTFKIEAIDVGASHSIAIDENGNVWATGTNNDGQLGLPMEYGNVDSWTQTSFTNAKKVYSGSNFSFIIDNDDKLYGVGKNTYNTLGLSNTMNKRSFTYLNVDDVDYVDGGSFHSLLIKKDGSIYQTGRSNYGQQGTGNANTIETWTLSSLPYSTHVAAGFGHSVVIDDNNQYWGTGRNHYGEIGMGYQSSFVMTWEKK